MRVKAEYGESFESLLRRFLRKVKKSGLMEELLERRSYKKPSVKKTEAARQRKRVLEKLKEEQTAN